MWSKRRYGNWELQIRLLLQDVYKRQLDVAFDVIGDIVLSAASQQYGGFTVPSVENILAPYAEKSYAK